MERKTFPNFILKIDADQGIVEHIFAVFGNVDLGNDMLHPGSFSKTIAERGNKVRVLDQHNTDSINRAIGKPLSMREISRAELPGDLLDRYPEATGGAWARTQFLMETPEGKGAFIRLKEGAIDEWSFAYDALDVDYSKVQAGGREVTVRNIRTVKLYEYSPVLWGMNPATTTISAKEKAGGEEPQEEQAASDLEAKVSQRPAENKAINLHERIQDVVRTFYQTFPDIHDPDSRMHVVYWVNQVWDEFVIVDQEGTAGNRTWKVLYSVGAAGAVNFAQPQDWIEVTMVFVPISNVQSSSAPPPGEQAGVKPHTEKAGPAEHDSQPPTSQDLLRIIEIAESEISLIEV